MGESASFLEQWEARPFNHEMEATIAQNVLEANRVVDLNWAQFQKQMELERKFGFLVGVLIGLRYQVTPEVREKIDGALKQVGEGRWVS